MVFQNPDNQIVATIVEEDVAFGCENLGLPPAEIRKRVDGALEAVGMTKYARHPSYNLSGGQKQRVAIAGVIAMRPEILILDEPASGLDPIGRDTVFGGLLEYREKTGATVIIVSHSMEDMARYTDDIIVMNDGKLAMSGDRSDIFARADELCRIGLDIPQVSAVMNDLRRMGYDLPDGVYTIDDAERAIAALLDERRGRHA